MNDKQLFLDKLRAALIDRDVSESDIQPYLERFDRFYDRMVNDPENAADGLLDDIDRIADNIAEQVSERYDEINRLAERTLTVDRVKDAETKNDPAQVAVPISEAVTTGSEVQSAPDAAQSEGDRMSEAYDEAFPEQDGEEQPERPPEYIDEEPSPNSTIFWVLFAVSLPVTIPLSAVGLAFFAGIWLLCLGIIIGSIALLVGGAAVGTALALVGVIYGISQLFSVVPVGLYELGLGVMIGSATMFCGILLYNFAIRLMPLLMRLWGRFFRFVIGKLRLLFGFLRRECAKL